MLPYMCIQMTTLTREHEQWKVIKLAIILQNKTLSVELQRTLINTPTPWPQAFSHILVPLCVRTRMLHFALAMD